MTSNSASLPPFPAPELPYQPQGPRKYRPNIGLIGCGGISQYHLMAYQKAGLSVVALCDIDRSKAEARRDTFFPDATIYQDFLDLLRRDDLEIVDIATHTLNRNVIIEASLLAGKHVLSQKPFVLDLDEGERLVALADRKGVQLAVNQNARWAPHFSYIRCAIRNGLLGTVSGMHCSVHWDHNWVVGTEFDKVEHLILYDYAIHWFDLTRCFLPENRPTRVYASTSRSPSQRARSPLLGQAIIEFDSAQVSLTFDGNTHHGPKDHTLVTGTQGTITSSGPGSRRQQVTFYSDNGCAQPHLEGAWFPDGFHGTMAELLSSIEEKRRPEIDAARNLESLAICFAAVASSQLHRPVVPGTVRQLPKADN